MAPAGRVESYVDDDGVRIVAMNGEVDLGSAWQVRAALEDVGDHVVVDLTNTTFIDSSVCSALAATHRAGTKVTIRGAHGAPLRSLEAMRLLSVFDVE